MSPIPLMKMLHCVAVYRSCGSSKRDTCTVISPLILCAHSHAPTLAFLFQRYNQARKIAFVPFPFPHAQLTSFFVFVICFVIPVLNLSWGVYIWFAAILNFFTVLCFAGIHEVARELENPFQNTPNDLPLTTYQAQLNEALVTMYSGYHPDAFWTVAAAKDTNNSIAVKAKNNLCTVAESNGEESDKGAENAPPTKAVTSNGNKVITIVQG